MRSELVFGATARVPNRYLLARLTSKTTRIFHKPHARLEETANDVLYLFASSNNEDALRPPLFTIQPHPANCLPMTGLPGPEAGLAAKAS